MIFYRKLYPGQPGTKKYVEKYGDSLVCIRYQYDDQKHIKTKTIELVVERKTWYSKLKWSPPNKIMFLRIEFGEIHLSKTVKEAGGKWNREKRAWELSLGQVRALGLEERIIKDYL